MFQVNVVETVPPLPSSAVTTTLNGALCDALWSMVPVMAPVF